MRWRYPFKTRKEAQKFVAEANRETGNKHRVFAVDYKVRIYKIFESQAQCAKYLKHKHNKFLRVD